MGSIIGWLTAVFAVATIGVVVGIAWHFRRKPVMWLIAARARDVAGHREAVSALEAAIAAERADGRTAALGQLESELHGHRRALRGLAEGREFAGEV